MMTLMLHLQVRKSSEKEISALRNDKFSLETTVHDLRETVSMRPCALVGD